MDATPITPGLRGDRAAGGLPPGPAADLGARWAALHDAAAAVAAIAGVPDASVSAGVRAFPAAIRAAGDWRRALAEQGIDDLTAIMTPGLSALSRAHAHGTRPVAAAQALWREFLAARDALLALVPPRH